MGKWVIVFAILLCLPVVFGATGLTVQQTLGFSGTSSDPSTLYQDGVAGKSDVGIELCGFGQRYVGAFYALNVVGTWNYVPVSYSSSSLALAFTSNDQGGGCFATSPGFVTLSPSELLTPDPDIKKAAFPGRLYIGYEASANPGTVSNFEYADSNAILSGSYSIARQFDESTRNVQVSTPSITFQPVSGSSFTKTASDGSYGISSDRQFVLGVCADDEGASCSGGGTFTSSTFPADISTGLSAGQVDDQQTNTVYVVANGLGYAMCIGANLQASINSVTPNPVYYSQNVTITIAQSNPRDTPFETNGGNVDVTSSFDVLVEIYPQGSPGSPVYTNQFTISSGMVSGGSTSQILTWPANVLSGTYTVRVTADVDGDITECSEGDNQATSNFDVRAITLPDIFIDGVETNQFDYPNVPYNLSFYFKNSDNETLNNANVTITEENGLVLTVPAQTYDRIINASNGTEQSGIVSKSQVNFYADYNGNISFTFIPTHNNFYNQEYGYLNFSQRVGNYSLYMTGYEEDLDEFIFIIDGEVLTKYPFEIINTSYLGPYNNKAIHNQDTVMQVMDFIYHTFTNFIDIVIS